MTDAEYEAECGEAELEFLGYANDWVDDPAEVLACPHEKEVTKEGPFLRRISCPECGFYYMEESS